MKYKLCALAFITGLSFCYATKLISQNVVTITDCNLQGWVKQTQTGTSLTLKTGINNPPIGKGSIEFSSPNVNFVRFRSTSYHNTLLSSITEFGYSTYVQNRENSKDVNYIVLLIDKNNDGRTDDNLVFDPRYQSMPYTNGNFPDQGLSVLGVWQTWDMLQGAWWLGPPPRPDPDFGGALFSLATYISLNPNAKIINDPALGGGGIRITGGAVPPIFAPNFKGNTDNFRIGINGLTTVYDFEFTAANAGADKNVIYGYGSNCSLLNGTAAGGVAPYTFSWSPGGTTPNNANTTVCPTVTTNYTFTVTDANGCTRIDEVTVNVNDVRCGNKIDKVKLCHNGEEICVAAAAVQAHLNHGDILGTCSSSLITKALKKNTNEKETLKELKISNFPNPFSGTSAIRYEVPYNGKIQIKLYDPAGKEIAILADGYRAAGVHQFLFNGSGFSSGIYLYRLTIESGKNIYSQTNKMMIVE